MPQIWATYEELAESLGTAVAEARNVAIAQNMARRKCSDGQTRVKLPHTLAMNLILKLPEVQTLCRASEERFMRIAAELRTLNPALQDAQNQISAESAARSAA
jgi:hypothetical protein